MCGRYTLTVTRDRLKKLIDRSLPKTYKPSYNISPGKQIVCFRNNSQEETANLATWGLPTKNGLLINARSETAHELPTFKKAWIEGRCLIPATGFIEWMGDGIQNLPFYVRPKTHEVVFFCGLTFDDTTAESSQDRVVIVTTGSNEALQKLHHRMPLTVSPEQANHWLSGSCNSGSAFEGSNEWDLQPISKQINKTKNDSKELLDPDFGKYSGQLDLF